jgi:predicted transcriptional regulator
VIRLKLQAFTVRLDEELYEELRKLAFIRRESKNEIVSKALALYLAKEKTNENE